MSIDHAKFLKRLKSLRNGYRDADFARLVGVPAQTLKRYESGSFPSIEIAAKIAQACGVSVDWLSGRTNVAADWSSSTERVEAERSAARGIDPALFRQVGRLVGRVHKEEGVRLPPDAALDEQAEAYNALITRADDPTDPAELESLLPWLEARLRKKLQAAAAEPGAGKRQA